MFRTDVTDRRGKKNWKSWLKTGAKCTAIALVVLVIFGAGVGVGNGSIGIHRANDQNKALPKDLDYSSVEQVYDLLKTKYDGTLTEQQLLDGIKTGLAQATNDPYTVYLNKKDAKDFNDQLDGIFSGIGAELGQDAQKNLIVVAPLADTPAAKAGLRAQDIIVSIDGKSTSGMSIDQAVTKIRGAKGTKVTLHLVRDHAQELTLSITRDNIKVPSVKWEIVDGNIGVMTINKFSDDTAKLSMQAAQEFKQKNVKGVVLDLRGNPGGLLTAAVSVSSLWLPDGALVLQEKEGGLVAATERANGENPLLGVPTAVLIDAGSASASEITAGALHDDNVATLFGVKSYGKGSVQQVQELTGGSELKVTVARWYRPNGQNIDKKGITPDKQIKMTDDDYKNKRDPQKDAALSFLRK